MIYPGRPNGNTRVLIIGRQEDQSLERKCEDGIIDQTDVVISQGM